MWKKHVIYLDGDPFHLSIPTFELFLKMMEAKMLHNENVWDQTLTCRAIVMDDGTLGFCDFYEGVKPGAIGMMDADGKGVSETVPEFQTVYWRPVLSPLTRLLEVDDVFRVETRDGEIFTGGCLMVDGEIQEVPTDGKCPKLLYNVDSMDITDLPMGESGHQPLSWIAKNGVLVCTRPLAKIRLKKLYDLGLLPHV